MAKVTGHLLIVLFSASVSFSQPAIVVETDLVEYELNAGEEQSFSLSIQNDGDQILRWTSTSELLEAPDHVYPGEGQDIWGRFRGINDSNEYCSPVGWDRDNDWMWVTNYNRNLAVAYSFEHSYTSFEEQCRIEIEHPMDGCWAAGSLWLPTWATSVVNKFDSEGNGIGAIEMPFRIYGMAADVVNGWMFFINGDDSTNIEVYELDDQGRLGDQLGTIRNHLRFHDNAVVYNLEWVPEHPNRNLWMINPANGNVYQISVNPEDWTCVETVQSFQVFEQADQPYCGVAHDGHNIWAGGHEASDIRIYDDGIDEFDWFTWSPKSGELAPGSEMALECELGTEHLIEGDYRHILHFLSNDPARNDLEVLINLLVFGDQIAGIAIPAAAMNNGVLDYNRYFGELFARGVYRLPVTLYNEGSADLEIVRILTENGLFQPEEFEFTLRPGQNRVVNLRFDAPPDTGIFEGLITVTTNDQNNDQFVLHLLASTIQGPRVRITPETLDIPFGREDSLNRIEIANLGQATLVWDHTVEYFGRRYHEGMFSLLGNRDPIPPDSVRILQFSIAWQFIRDPSDVDSVLLHFNTNDPLNPRITVVIKVLDMAVGPELHFPSAFTISAFPNPFNSSTTITYSLPKPGIYAIEVVDISGRLVARLSDGWKEAGSYREVLNGNGIPSGVLILNVSDGSDSRRQTIQLIR